MDCRPTRFRPWRGRWRGGCGGTVLEGRPAPWEPAPHRRLARTLWRRRLSPAGGAEPVGRRGTGAAGRRAGASAWPPRSRKRCATSSRPGAWWKSPRCAPPSPGGTPPGRSGCWSRTTGWRARPGRPNQRASRQIRSGRRTTGLSTWLCWRAAGRGRCSPSAPGTARPRPALPSPFQPGRLAPTRRGGRTPGRLRGHHRPACRRCRGPAGGALPADGGVPGAHGHGGHAARPIATALDPKACQSLATLSQSAVAAMQSTPRKERAVFS